MLDMTNIPFNRLFLGWMDKVEYITEYVRNKLQTCTSREIECLKQLGKESLKCLPVRHLAVIGSSPRLFYQAKTGGSLQLCSTNTGERAVLAVKRKRYHDSMFHWIEAMSSLLTSRMFWSPVRETKRAGLLFTVLLVLVPRCYKKSSRRRRFSTCFLNGISAADQIPVNQALN